MSPNFDDNRRSSPSGLSFGAGMAFEAALVLVAFVWGWLFKQRPLVDLRWNLQAFGLGLAGALPPFIFFLWTLRSNLRFLARHRDLVQRLIQHVFAGWTVPQFALISACAGFCEETLFRGAIQASLVVRLGPALALGVASLLFGASHLITWTYGILAALIGCYLGVLYLWTGNLLVPMTAHFVYDFIALVWLVQTWRTPPPEKH